MSRTSARVGRPKKPAGERKRNILRFRATDQLVERLKSAARDSGRSISEEIESQLERSSYVDDERWGDTRTRLFAETIVSIIKQSDAAAAAPWHSSPENAKRMIEKLKYYFDMFVRWEELSADVWKQFDAMRGRASGTEDASVAPPGSMSKPSRKGGRGDSET